MGVYYRVETLVVNKNKTTGGFASAINCFFRWLLGVDMTVSDDELAKLVIESSDPCVIRLGTIMDSLLGGVEKPKIYLSDKPNHYCLYTRDGFYGRYEDFEDLADFIDMYYPEFKLIYLEVSLPSEAILYEDETQIVISKADYEKYRPEPSFFIDDDFDDDDDEI